MVGTVSWESKFLFQAFGLDAFFCVHLIDGQHYRPLSIVLAPSPALFGLFWSELFFSAGQVFEISVAVLSSID